MQKKNSVKNLFGMFVKIVLSTVVFLFLAMFSIDFFSFGTPPEQWYMAYLGFGMTGGGIIGYMVMLKQDADTPLKKAVAISMLFVSVVGELVSAGFGFQIEAWRKQGMELSAEFMNSMALAIKILGGAHGIALILYFAGDEIFDAFADKDGDGVPDAFQRRKMQSYALTADAPKTQQEAPQRIETADGGANPTRAQ